MIFLHPSDVQNQAMYDLGPIPSGWVLRTGKAAHLLIGHQHQLSLAQVTVTLSCNLTPQIIFPHG